MSLFGTPDSRTDDYFDRPLRDDFSTVFKMAQEGSDSIRFTKKWTHEKSRDWIEPAPDESRVFRIDPKIVTDVLHPCHKNGYCAPEEISYDLSHLPFPIVFIGWGGPHVVEILDSATRTYWRCEVNGLAFDANESTAFVFQRLSRKTDDSRVLEWDRSIHSLPGGPWGVVAEHVLEFISTHERSVHTLSKKRVKALRKSRGAKNVPQQYYEVLQQPLRHHKSQSEGTHASPSFQHDVRGHWAHRVKRIQGTLKDHERSRWEVRSNDRHEYRFVCGSRISDEDRRYLWSIGESPPSKGWYLRITRYWVRGHKRGPEDTYVPSVHVMGPNLATHPTR